MSIGDAIGIYAILFGLNAVALVFLMWVCDDAKRKEPSFRSHFDWCAGLDDVERT